MAQAQLPHNLEAEKSVLGLLLSGGVDPDDVVAELRQSDFYEQQHAHIFRICCDLYEEGETPDLITVSDRFSETNYLSRLSQSILPGNLKAHIASIRESAVRRHLQQAAHKILESAGDKSLDTKEALDKAQASILDVADRRRTGEAVSVGSLLSGIFNEIDQLREHPETLAGIPTGYTTLDHLLNGFQPTNLVILAARPRMGKTALTGNLMINQAVKHQIPVAMFSLEMDKEWIVKRILSSMSKVSFEKVKSGRLTEEDYRRLDGAAVKLKEAPLFIDDSPSLSVLELRSRARKLQRLHGIQAIYVDYLTKLGSGRRRETRDQEVTDIATSLKGLARELNLPVICLAQLNRECEKRTKKRPVLSDLRESGGIEQEADEVLFLYRDEVYNSRDDNPNKGIAELIIAKQRNGQEGLAKMSFIGSSMAFENLADLPEEV